MKRAVRWTHPQGARVEVYGSVFGLSSEQQAVTRMLEEQRPEVIMMGVSPEALQAVAADRGEPAVAEVEDLSPLTQYYLEHLSRFGPTHVPALDVYAAWRHADQHGVPIVGIDLDDHAHSRLYGRRVGVFENIRKERRQFKAASRLAEEPDVEHLVVAWDRVFFPTKGLRRVEREREVHMAQGIRDGVQSYRTASIIIPLERHAGILAQLESPSS